MVSTATTSVPLAPAQCRSNSMGTQMISQQSGPMMQQGFMSLQAGGTGPSCGMRPSTQNPPAQLQGVAFWPMQCPQWQNCQGNGDALAGVGVVGAYNAPMVAGTMVAAQPPVFTQAMQAQMVKFS